jgi:hypothetical protein
MERAEKISSLLLAWIFQIQLKRTAGCRYEQAGKGTFRLLTSAEQGKVGVLMK